MSYQPRLAFRDCIIKKHREQAEIGSMHTVLFTDNWFNAECCAYCDYYHTVFWIQNQIHGRMYMAV